MTIVFLVSGDSLRGEPELAGQSVSLPIGVGPNGHLAQGGEVAVLLVDDQQDIGSQQLDRFKLVEPSWAVFHPPLLDARRAWLEQRGVRLASNPLSRQHGNRAYDQVRAVLRSADDDTRREVCRRIVHSYETGGLLIDLEELAARIALRPWLSEQCAQGATEAKQRRDSNDGAILAAIENVFGRLRGGALQSFVEGDQLKGIDDLTVEDVEAAAAALLP
jgi:hypothetical protein